MKYITTPIYYANDIPHIGHAVTTLAADVMTRYWHLRKEEVFFLTGTDEHGAKIEQAAQKAGEDTKAFVDKISKEFEESWQSLNIQPDGFIRTTDPQHEAVVERFLQELYDKDAIYKGSYKGWYCVGCEEFKTETQIGPNNTCPIHLTPLIEIEEEAYLFRLSTYRDQLLKLIEDNRLKIQPESRKNEVLGFIQHEGLRDVAISRKSVAWGIPLPWDKNHTVYVWVDALLNYLSATEPDGPEFASGKRPEFPPTLQLIGKDILRFHAIIWPALLLAAEKPLPEKLFVHGYFTINGQKISKSLGNVIQPSELIERYGVDATRYLLLAAVPFGSDGDISLERLDNIYSEELANNIGNLISRFQSMILKYKDGKVPLIEDEQSKELLEGAVWARTGFPALINFYNQEFEQVSLDKVLQLVRFRCDDMNRFIEIYRPWELAKKGDVRDVTLDEVLAALAENVYYIGILLSSFMPEASKKILSIFGASIGEINYDTLLEENHTGGKVITPIEPLFPRLEV